jgi:formamidopyrimidine-DNA glycosylase
MPELPDVETYKRYLDATALHQRIAHVTVVAPIVLAETSPQTSGARSFITASSRASGTANICS